VADALEPGPRGRVPEGALATREYRIGKLVREAGITVRTVRYYQERKLLPPPRRAGRVGWYSEAHLTRLRIIGDLLNRGHTLGGAGELLSAWERGYDLATLLGIEQAMTASWSDEVPVPVTVAGSWLCCRTSSLPKCWPRQSGSATSRSTATGSVTSAAVCWRPRRSWCGKASRCPRSWPPTVSCRLASTSSRRCSWIWSSATSSAGAADHLGRMMSRGSRTRSSGCAPSHGP
jgi:DNA-binding transcriptional MerR regulator